MVVLVTGANGQLGQSLRFIASDYPQVRFEFLDSQMLDITDGEKTAHIFKAIKPDYCINTAAYTAVDKAESEPEKAFRINADGARNIAQACKNTDCTLIHLSTDFIFSGAQSSAYTEEDIPDPSSVYGKSKLAGEIAIRQTLQRYFIIRTSWVYSPFGHNFMKTMLRLAGENKQVSVVNDQIGCPTSAIDLAETLLKIILFAPEKQTFGIYNFSNEGYCSWYDFAGEIFKRAGQGVDLRPIGTSQYPTAAKRPKYSVLDKSKIQQDFGIRVPHWEQSLDRVLALG